MDWAVVFKALGSLAGRAAGAAMPGLIRSWRVAFETRRKAKKSGIRIRYFALRSFIDEWRIFELFHSPTTERMNEVAPALGDCIKANDQSHSDVVPELLAIIADAYVHSLPPSEASRFEGEATRKHVTSEVSRLHESSLKALDIEANYDLLNAYRAEEARQVLKQWPTLSRALAELVAAGDRKQLFQDWAVNRPSWLIDTPASVLCWLSSAAKDYGAAEAARKFLHEAIAAGASPRSYWVAKAALAAPLSLEEAKEQLGQARDHPLGAALWAELNGSHHAAIEQIRAWDPASQEDHATKKLILAQALAAIDDENRAIDEAVEGYSAHGSSGCALYAAKLLVRRGALRRHPNFMRDLATALELATAVRASRRSWGGDSSEAVLTMISAYRLLGSPEQAWRTGTIAPEGSATLSESSDVQVITETARTAAELGMTQRARDLASRLPAGPSKDYIEAILAEDESGFESASPLWTRVLASTSDPEDALNVGLRLAHHGHAPEWPAWITADYGSDVADIDLISALVREVPGALPKARARAATSRQVFHGLMFYYISQKEYAAAADVAETAGGRWNDPEAWLRAAEIWVKAKQRDRAIEAAEQAIRVGGTTWLRAKDARMILIESRSAESQWDKALIEATRLLETDPEADPAKWAFITCQFMTSDYGGAWESFVRLGAPKPRTPGDAKIWLQLHSRYAPDLGYISQAEVLAQQWPENEQLRAGIVLSMMHSNAKPQTDEQVRQYQELLTNFIADFPDSSLIRAISVNENDPFESIKAMLPDPAGRHEAMQPILKGELPVGLATHLSGKSYAEVCLIRGAGKVFAGDPLHVDNEIEVITSNLSKRVVIDTTVLNTFALLGADIAREWLGLFSSGVTPTEAIHDAQSAVLSLSPKSTASIGIDAVSGGPRIFEISEEEAETRLNRATILLALARELISIPHPKITELPRIKSTDKEFQWLLSLDLAKKLDLPFWCDDRALRQVAAAAEVQSFGTPALLEYFRRDGVVSISGVDAYEATLIHHYYTGIRFDSSVMKLAAEMDSWKPLGTAAAISESGSTATPEQQIHFVLLALQHCAEDPEAVQMWVASVASWLESVSPDTPTAEANLRFWFSTLLKQKWIDSSSLPHVLAGLRSDWSRKTDLVSLVPEVLGELYADVAAQTNHAIAAEYVRELIRLAPAEDQSGVLQRIIAL
ncbi:tetratricopeptide (TPR) repeat protein [Arthrobacter globiformis]|uniref:tetratricopeptide repeat protein n=1 Tax=Arthrobacter globiformis TaxID=1665 RepID=UPI00277EB156|nr:hypothetical protein [Arthrobacter globiformis]MDQ1060772.1 tetratricopeptide (TPR) repeat protein [Arthrobacter globiformis]